MPSLVLVATAAAAQESTPAQQPPVDAPPPPPKVAPLIPPEFFDQVIGWDTRRHEAVIGREHRPLTREELFHTLGRPDLVAQSHALRTRRSGARKFISFHVLVPGEWSVQRGHELLEEIEGDVRRAFPRVTVFTHLESLDDPRAWDDTELDRAGD